MGIRDWDIVTSYVDSVTTSLKTVTFPKVQEQVKVKNQGNANLTYTIGTQSGTLTPGQSVTVNESISSFTIQSTSGVQSFEVRAVEKGTEKTEDNSSDALLQLSDIATNISKYASLQEALSDIGSQKKTLYIASAVNVTGNTTIPSNVSLWLSPTGNFNISGGVTLTINGTISAGMWRIFNGSGSVSGKPKVPFAYAEWFGAVTDDNAVDNAPYIMSALNFFHTVQLTKGVYYLNSTITLPYGSTLLGIGRLTYTGYDDTTILQQGNLPAFTFASGAGMVTLDNFTIKGNTANPNNDGIVFNSYGSYSTLTNLFIYQCGGNGIHATGSAATGVDLCRFSSVKVDSCSGYGIKLNLDPAGLNGFNTSHFEVVECMRNKLGGFYMSQVDSLTFTRCHSFWNENPSNIIVHGYEIKSATNIDFVNCWAEGNGEHSLPDPEHKSAGFFIDGASNINFITPRTVTQSRGIHVKSGTNIVIDNPTLSTQTWATSLDILIEATANSVKVANLNYNTNLVIANFSTTSYIETNSDYPTSGRIPMNSKFKRTQKGKAECYAQGTATQYQFNATVDGVAGNSYLTWTTSNNLRIGDNILISGAGTSGGGLNAQVTDVSLVDKKIYISTPVVTSVTGAVPATIYPVTHSEIIANTHSATTVTGYWQVGDIIWYANPNVYFSTGEVCVFAGTGGSGGSAVWTIYGYMSGQTGSTSAPVTGGTINTVNGAAIYTSIRTNPTSNITGVKLSSGSYAGQEVTIFNESAYTITFDVSANSKVAGGTSEIIASLTAGKFSWDAGASLWYRVK